MVIFESTIVFDLECSDDVKKLLEIDREAAIACSNSLMPRDGTILSIPIERQYICRIKDLGVLWFKCPIRISSAPLLPDMLIILHSKRGGKRYGHVNRRDAQHLIQQPKYKTPEVGAAIFSKFIKETQEKPLKTQTIKIVRTLDARKKEDREYAEKYCKGTFVIFHNTLNDSNDLIDPKKYKGTDGGFFPFLGLSPYNKFASGAVLSWNYISIFSVEELIGKVFTRDDSEKAIQFLQKTVEYKDLEDSEWKSGTLIYVDGTDEYAFKVQRSHDTEWYHQIRVIPETLEEPKKEEVKEVVYSEVNYRGAERLVDKEVMYRHHHGDEWKIGVLNHISSLPIGGRFLIMGVGSRYEIKEIPESEQEQVNVEVKVDVKTSGHNEVPSHTHVVNPFSTYWDSGRLSSLVSETLAQYAPKKDSNINVTVSVNGKQFKAN